MTEKLCVCLVCGVRVNCEGRDVQGVFHPIIQDGDDVVNLNWGD